ncbi:hypothetical protein GNF86_01455 [Clostridium perfringens]
MNQENLLEQKELRESVINRLEVLDSVGEILLLPNTEYATTEMVANYYGVKPETIKSLIFDNNDEIISDGYQVIEKEELSSFKKLCQIKSRARSLAIFPKRAILRVGMLLRDSEIAKEIRTKLLDITHDSEKGNGNINTIINEIDEEKQLQMQLGIAICEGNMQKVVEIQTKINSIKNARITQLEKDKENIIIHALTIEESRDVVNRLIRTIAYTKDNGYVARTWGELYKKLNYKLHINIKSREKKNKRDSYLSTLSQEEMFETEKIVRSWAMELGIDLEKTLKIS